MSRRRHHRHHGEAYAIGQMLRVFFWWPILFEVYAAVTIVVIPTALLFAVINFFITRKRTGHGVWNWDMFRWLNRVVVQGW